MTSEVTLEDWGLSTLSLDARRLLGRVMDDVALELADRMRALMVARGAYETGSAAESVTVFGAKNAESGTAAEFVRNVGPTRFYAFWLELGWLQVVAYGQKLRQAVHHPGLHFARDACESMAGRFEAAIAEAMARLGR